MNGPTGFKPLEQSGALAHERVSSQGLESGRLRMTPPGFTGPDGAVGRVA